MSEEELKNKMCFRDNMLSLSEQVRYRLDVIKNAKAKTYTNRNSLYNIAIVFNNKISEILHYYYERGVLFFDESIISNAVYEYLDNYFLRGIDLINAYIKNCVIPMENRSIILYNDQLFLDMYKDLTDKIFSFDIKKDAVVAVKFLLEKNMQLSNDFRSIFPKHYKEILEATIDNMKELGLEDDVSIVKDELYICSVKCLSINKEGDTKNEKKSRK